MYWHTFIKWISGNHWVIIPSSSYACDSFKPSSLNDFAKIICACVHMRVCVCSTIQKHSCGILVRSTISQPHHHPPTDMWISLYMGYFVPCEFLASCVSGYPGCPITNMTVREWLKTGNDRWRTCRELKYMVFALSQSWTNTDKSAFHFSLVHGTSK